MYTCDIMRISPAVKDALGITLFHHQTCAIEIVLPPFLETAITAAMFLGLARPCKNTVDQKRFTQLDAPRHLRRCM